MHNHKRFHLGISLLLPMLQIFHQRYCSLTTLYFEQSLHMISSLYGVVALNFLDKPLGTSHILCKMSHLLLVAKIPFRFLSYKCFFWDISDSKHHNRSNFLLLHYLHYLTYMYVMPPLLLMRLATSLSTLLLCPRLSHRLSQNQSFSVFLWHSNCSHQ